MEHSSLSWYNQTNTHTLVFIFMNSLDIVTIFLYDCHKPLMRMAASLIDLWEE